MLRGLPYIIKDIRLGGKRREKKKKRKNARSGVRTHASEENSTLNCRLGPLGHPCLQDKERERENDPTSVS